MLWTAKPRGIRDGVSDIAKNNRATTDPVADRRSNRCDLDILENKFLLSFLQDGFDGTSSDLTQRDRSKIAWEVYSRSQGETIDNGVAVTRQVLRSRPRLERGHVLFPQAIWDSSERACAHSGALISN